MSYLLINYLFYILSLVKSDRNTLVIVFILFTVLAGTRFTAGGDIDGYISTFEVIKDLAHYLQGDFVSDENYLKYYLEWFFTLINSFVQSCGFEYYMVFFIVSTLINIYLIKSIQLINRVLDIHYMIFFIVYFNFVFFITQMWYIRQGLAGIFILYAFLQYFNKQKIKAYLYMILALGTHISSSMILIPSLWAVLKLKSRYFLILLLISLIVYILKLSLLNYFIDLSGLIFNKDVNVLLIYAESEFAEEQESLALINYLYIVISFYILLLRRELFDENIYYKLISSYVILSAIFSLLFYELSIMTRINISINIGLAFWFAIEYYNFREKKIYLIFIILLSFLYFIRVMVLNDYNYNLFFPYDNWIYNIIEGVFR